MPVRLQKILHQTEFPECVLVHSPGVGKAAGKACPYGSGICAVISGCSGRSARKRRPRFISVRDLRNNPFQPVRIMHSAPAIDDDRLGIRQRIDQRESLVDTHYENAG